ncbi:MAG: phosphate/phosphite/phosphonate ABC transporter substrate-binding protein [Pseudonocardiaceae bacterium]
MSKRYGRIALATALAALLIASGCGQSIAADRSGGDPPALVFVAVPSLQPANLQQAYQPMLKMLSKEIGREIRVQYATDYSAVITGLRDGKIDIAALGPLSYVLAKRQGAQITLVAAQTRDGRQPLEYYSDGIVPVGSSITTLAGFRGKRICFPDRYSTSGYLYPSVGLLDVGIQPEHDITPIFAGGHDASVLAVANHQCDAGFAEDSLVGTQLAEEHQIQPGKITTVWMSEPIPAGPIVIANGLAPQLRQRLATALQQHANADYLRAHGFCQGECAIADRDTYGYVAVEDSFYDRVRAVCRINQLQSLCE